MVYLTKIYSFIFIQNLPKMRTTISFGGVKLHQNVAKAKGIMKRKRNDMIFFILSPENNFLPVSQKYHRSHLICIKLVFHSVILHISS